MNTRNKIALLLAIFNVVMVLVFGCSVYYFLQNYSYTDFYKRLDTRAGIAARYHFESDTTDANNLKALRQEHLEMLDSEREYVLRISSIDSIPALASRNDLPEILLRKTLANGKERFKNGNTFYSAIRQDSGGMVHLVVVSANNYYDSHHQVLLRNIIAVGLVFTLFLGIGIAVYFSKHVYDPIRKIIEKVNQISTNNIHLRVDDYEKDGEINTLIHTFNGLLDRMETTFETHKNFISNASHEISTPLTSIIGEADVALIKDRATAEYKEALTNILQQSERLRQITESLLFLAQTGYKENKLVLELLRTDELVWESIKIMDKLMPGHLINFDLSLLPENPIKLKIMGNKQLLLLAITNLLTNACKYSANKPVTISVGSTNSSVIVLITDKGIGIPEEEMKFIYDPFFRASNTQLYDGYGIGMPLTRNIVKIHKGTLVVTSTVGVGTSVQMTLPLAILN